MTCREMEVGLDSRLGLGVGRESERGKLSRIKWRWPLIGWGGRGRGQRMTSPNLKRAGLQWREWVPYQSYSFVNRFREMF